MKFDEQSRTKIEGEKSFNHTEWVCWTRMTRSQIIQIWSEVPKLIFESNFSTLYYHRESMTLDLLFSLVLKS